ncbi:very short patch repair endonuclease [Nocardia sp. NPDC004278]
MELSSWASTPAVRRSMRSNRSRDTRPELALRRILWNKGLRYRVAARPTESISRRIDIVFGPSKVAVEVQGCFWHGCPQHYRAPAGNVEFWRSKLERNRIRDIAVEQALADAGWLLITVWEHDDVSEAAEKIAAAVRNRHPSSASKY